MEDNTGSEMYVNGSRHSKDGAAWNAQEATYTVDDAVNKAGFGKFQMFLTFLAGLQWLADAIEIFLLSLIGNFIACDPNFEIKNWQIAFMSSMVFAGIGIGCPIFGVLADIYGRKKSLGASVVMMLIFGVASAAAPNYAGMVGIRTCMGIALGGAAQGLTLCSEYCPAHTRGKAGFYLCYFWSFGTAGVILLAWLVMTISGSWRVLLLAASIPALIVVISIKWYPESARYYLVSGRRDDAVLELSRMARINGSQLPPGQLNSHPTESNRGRIADLFTSQFTRTTLLLWYIGFASAFTYYGIALISPALISNGSLRSEAGANENSSDTAKCENYKNDDYLNMLWVSAAEFPGILLFTVLIERIGRKWLIGGGCFISAVLTLLLLLNTYKALILIILFACRGIILATFQLIYIVASEVYPTTVRALGVGSTSAVCRVAGMIVPYVAQTLVIASPVAAMCLLSGIILLAGVASFLLPFETRGANLREAVDS